MQVALAISPPFFMYHAIAERTTTKAQRYPELYGIFPKGHEAAVPEQKRDQLQWYHKLANAAYNNPLALIGGFGLPAVAAIFYQQGQGHAHLKLTQKVG